MVSLIKTNDNKKDFSKAIIIQEVSLQIPQTYTSKMMSYLLVHNEQESV